MLHRYPTSKIPKLVRDGQRPAAPPKCPRDVYEVMISCWHPVAEHRPTPAQVVAALPRSITEDNAPTLPEGLHVDLQTKYEGYRDSALLEGVTPRMSSEDADDETRVRSPSPLIHMSLVGLTKRDSGEAKAAHGTVSSKPSNYTSSATSSMKSGRSGKRSPATGLISRDHPAFVHELFDPPPPDDGPLPPTMISTPRHSREVGESALDGGAPDDYIQIGSVTQRPEPSKSPREALMLRRSLSSQEAERRLVSGQAKTSSLREPDHHRGPTRSPSPERRKSAVALALEGVATLDEDSRVSPEPLPDPPLWVQNVNRRFTLAASTTATQHRIARDGSLASDPSSQASVNASDGASEGEPLAVSLRPRAATSGGVKPSRYGKGKPFATLTDKDSRREVQPPLAGHTGGWLHDGSSGAMDVGVRAPVDAAAAAPASTEDQPSSLDSVDAKPTKDAAGGAAGKGGGWFKRTRRSSTQVAMDERALHSSPEPGVLPEGPSWRPKPALSLSSLGDRFSSAPVNSSYTRGDVPPRGDRLSHDSPSPLSGSLSGGLTLTASARQRIEKRRSADSQPL